PLTSSPLFSVLFLAIHQMPLSSISPTDRASISPTQPMGYVYDGLLIEKLQERDSKQFHGTTKRHRPPASPT
ncbi:MAG: hypothetical protein L0K56_08530, partial [Corynebacterium sp.]|nr:hypothetical protein [Corynebacterium sp.]